MSRPLPAALSGAVGDRDRELTDDGQAVRVTGGVGLRRGRRDLGGAHAATVAGLGCAPLARWLHPGCCRRKPAGTRGPRAWRSPTPGDPPYRGRVRQRALDVTGPQPPGDAPRSRSTPTGRAHPNVPARAAAAGADPPAIALASSSSEVAAVAHAGVGFARPARRPRCPARAGPADHGSGGHGCAIGFVNVAKRGNSARQSARGSRGKAQFRRPHPGASVSALLFRLEARARVPVLSSRG